MLAIKDGFGWYLGTGFGVDTVPVDLPLYPADDACTFEALEAIAPTLDDAARWAAIAGHLARDTEAGNLGRAYASVGITL